MKVIIDCTVYDSFIEDEQVHAFRFYTPSGESARSERCGKVFSKVSFACRISQVASTTLDPSGGVLVVTTYWRPRSGDPNPEQPGEKLSILSYLPTNASTIERASQADSKPFILGRHTVIYARYLSKKYLIEFNLHSN
jgi:hypothetical protein